MTEPYRTVRGGEDYPIWVSDRHPPSEYLKTAFGKRRRAMRSIRQRMAEATEVAMAGAFEDLEAKRIERYRVAGIAPFLDALLDWVNCQWHKELGFKTFAHMGRELWVGDLDYWRGWEALAFLPRNPGLLNLARHAWQFRMRSFGRVSHLLDNTNWRVWVTLVLHFTDAELTDAAKAWGKVSKTGYYGQKPLIFVPLWIPEDEYPEELNGRGPAWEALKAHQEKTRLDR